LRTCFQEFFEGAFQELFGKLDIMIREPGYVFRRLHIVLHHVHIDVESDILACLEAAPVLDKYHELLWDNVLIREGH
jgi:hypothetical protein